MNIVELIRTTADNQHALMLKMAVYIEKLEKELAELKAAPATE